MYGCNWMQYEVQSWMPWGLPCILVIGLKLPLTTLGICIYNLQSNLEIVQAWQDEFELYNFLYQFTSVHQFVSMSLSQYIGVWISQYAGASGLGMYKGIGNKGGDRKYYYRNKSISYKRKFAVPFFSLTFVVVRSLPVWLVTEWGFILCAHIVFNHLYQQYYICKSISATYV